MPGYSEAEARAAIADSISFADALRRLGMRAAGGNFKVLRKWVATWNISTDHFDPRAAARAGAQRRIPLERILVEHSTYSRFHLKLRLFEEGIKARSCELCDQGETWRGQHMSLILDHINGVFDDNRLENLRMVCPNCAATFDTHCGRKHHLEERRCIRCGKSFRQLHPDHRYCSRQCSSRVGFTADIPRPDLRMVERPPYEQLLEELAETSYLAVGRRYSVSDNAIRKWVRFYERQAAREAASSPQSPAGEEAA